MYRKCQWRPGRTGDTGVVGVPVDAGGRTGAGVVVNGGFVPLTGGRQLLPGLGFGFAEGGGGATMPGRIGGRGGNAPPHIGEFQFQ